MGGSALVQSGRVAVASTWKVPGAITSNLREIKSGQSVLSSIYTQRKGISLAGSRRSPLEYASFQTVRNESTVINKRTYSGHALDRMQDRGLMPSVIENAIETGQTSINKIPGRVEYFDPLNNIRVIVGDNGRIITVIPKRQNL